MTQTELDAGSAPSQSGGGYQYDAQTGEVLRDASGRPVYRAPRHIPFKTEAPAIDTRWHENRRTGEVRLVPVGIDPGFEHNPGLPGTPALDELVRQKLDSAPTALAQAARAAGLTPEGAQRQQGSPLGPPASFPSRPELDQRAREHVLGLGKRGGLEFSVGYNAHDPLSWAASKAGSSNSVSVPTALVELLDDPVAAVILHHNHPRSTPLSTLDLAILGRVGVACVVAHGHDGSRFQAMRGENFAQMSGALMTNLHHELTRQMTQLQAKGIPADSLFHHLYNQVLHRAKIVSYRASLNKANKALRQAHQAELDELVKELANFIQETPHVAD